MQLVAQKADELLILFDRYRCSVHNKSSHGKTPVSKYYNYFGRLIIFIVAQVQQRRNRKSCRRYSILQITYLPLDNAFIPR